MIQWQTRPRPQYIRRPRYSRDLSGVHVDGVKVQSESPPATTSGAVAINQGSSNVVIAHQIVRMFSATAPASTVAGHAKISLPHGVSIDGTFLTPGAAAVAISNTPVSVDSSNHIHLAGVPCLLPTASPAPSTTLFNGAVAVPLGDGVSI